MHTLITPEMYYDPQVFALEKERLFKKVWLYIGTTEEVANHQDYICFNLFDKSIVVMNFNGVIKAFHNVCSHRFSKICTENSGNGLLQCPYHGWTYDENGSPYGIPQRKTFKELDVEALKLTEFPLETCGKFMFIKMQTEGPSLAEYLGRYFLSLQNISEALGAEAHQNEIIINANWKVVVENTIEAYHVFAAHKNTLNNMGLQERSFDYNTPHSYSEIKFKTKIADSKKLDKTYAGRPIQVEDFFHHLIFPSMTAATTYGATFSIQQIVPLSATQTKFVSKLYATKLNGADSAATALVKAYNHSAADFNWRVFEEDKFVCENVQQGIMQTERTSGPLCHDEQRIHEFHQAYLDFLRFE